MERLNPEKIHVIFQPGTTSEALILPRRYTLTHSDRTGDLFLTIGSDYNKPQISKLYTRLMRDEVLAELINTGKNMEVRVYCHVSGGLVIGPAGWRYHIFQSELPLVMEAFRYGDRVLFEKHAELDEIPVIIYFQSANKRFNKIENWGKIGGYR